MSYVVTQDDFERVVEREFAFLLEAGLAGPAIERRDDELRAGFSRDDLRIRVHCDIGCDDVMTVIERPRLGRQLLLETVHAVAVGDARYPIADGGSWSAPAELERRLALEATLLRENFRRAAEDDALYEEAGGHVEA